MSTPSGPGGGVHLGSQIVNDHTATPMTAAQTHLAAVVEQREREILELRSLQARQTEDQVLTLRREMSALQLKYGKLRDDFQFNLKVIDEREQELASHEDWFEKCKRVLGDRDHEISELKARLADVQVDGDLISHRLADTERGYQERIAHQATELEALRYQREQDQRATKAEIDAVPLCVVCVCVCVCVCVWGVLCVCAGVCERV